MNTNINVGDVDDVHVNDNDNDNVNDNDDDDVYGNGGDNYGDDDKWGPAINGDATSSTTVFTDNGFVYEKNANIKTDHAKFAS